MMKSSRVFLFSTAAAFALSLAGCGGDEPAKIEFPAGTVQPAPSTAASDPAVPKDAVSQGDPTEYSK